jgi:hypothetical protein
MCRVLLTRQNLTSACDLVGAIRAVVGAIAHPASRNALLAIATQELIVGTKSQSLCVEF